jgi:hypothetical protein
VIFTMTRSVRVEPERRRFDPISGERTDAVSEVPSTLMIVAVIMEAKDWPDPPAKRTETQGSVATVFLVIWIATCWKGGITSVGWGSKGETGISVRVGEGVMRGEGVGVATGVTTGLLHPATRRSPAHRRRRGRQAFIEKHYQPTQNGFPS